MTKQKVKSYVLIEVDHPEGIDVCRAINNCIGLGVADSQDVFGDPGLNDADAKDLLAMNIKQPIEITPIRQAVKDALKWVLEDFPENGSFPDYQEWEGFTDDQYVEMMEVLSKFAN